MNKQMQGEGNTVPDGTGFVPAFEAPPEQASPDDKQGVKTYISWWQGQIQQALKHYKEDFESFDENSNLVRGLHWSNNPKDDRYVVNLIQSEIEASVATLYAKNPTFSVRRRPRMDFAIWDETPEELEMAKQAQMMAMQSGKELSPAIAALLQDIQEGQMVRRRLDRIAKAAELVVGQQVEQQEPLFKQEMKQLIRRVETTSVGYVKLVYRRLDDSIPDSAAQLADLQSRLNRMTLLLNKTENPEDQKFIENHTEELRIAVTTMEQQKGMVIRKGLQYFFPRSKAIIIDPACSQIRGFVGARWLAEEYHMPADMIYEIYNKDVSSAKSYTHARSSSDFGWCMSPKPENAKKSYEDMYRVWEIYHKPTGSTFTICEGFDEYLVEPTVPSVLLERFFPYYPLMFGEVEDNRSIYPPSTVQKMKHAQREINRSKEALRQHRKHNAPNYAAIRGVLDEQDRANIKNMEPHEVIELNAINDKTKVDDLIQSFKKVGIDPNLYNTEGSMEDIRITTRRPDARLGGASSATATADSLAEESRQVEDRSKSDDLDDMLTELARDSITTLMMEMNIEEVQEIAGRGAAWPESDPTTILRDLTIKTVAGSSGRPNRALETATFQRLYPMLTQTPGISPRWLAEQGIALADANVDLAEAYIEGQPSIMAMNSMTQMSTGNPETDPNQQGARGGDNRRQDAPGQDLSMTPNNPTQNIPDTSGDNTILQQG